MLRADPWIYLFAALLVLTLPLNWLAAAILAAAFHELCHIVALHLLGGRMLSLRAGVGGAVIEAEFPDRGRELLCALAGPLGSLLLMGFCHVFPKLALCAMVQGLFNLLPIYPLDGGRVLHCALEFFCPGRAEQIGNLAEGLTYFALLLMAVAGTVVLSLGVTPLLLVFMLILKAILRKRPCKRSQIRVQ